MTLSSMDMCPKQQEILQTSNLLTLFQFWYQVHRFMAEPSSSQCTTAIAFPLSGQSYGCAEFYGIGVCPQQTEKLDTAPEGSL